MMWWVSANYIFTSYKHRPTVFGDVYAVRLLSYILHCCEDSVCVGPDNSDILRSAVAHLEKALVAGYLRLKWPLSFISALSLHL